MTYRQRCVSAVFHHRIGGDPPFLGEAACHPARRPKEVKGEWFLTADKTAHPLAVKLCGTCAVRRECLAWAIAHAELGGLWGGYTQQERDLIAERTA